MSSFILKYFFGWFSSHLVRFVPSCTAKHLLSGKICSVAPPPGNSSRTHHWEKEWEEEKSPTLSGIQTHDLLIARQALSRCAATTTRSFLHCQWWMPLGCQRNFCHCLDLYRLDWTFPHVFVVVRATDIKRANTFLMLEMFFFILLIG